MASWETKLGRGRSIFNIFTDSRSLCHCQGRNYSRKNSILRCDSRTFAPIRGSAKWQSGRRKLHTGTLCTTNMWYCQPQKQSSSLLDWCLLGCVDLDTVTSHDITPLSIRPSNHATYTSHKLCKGVLPAPLRRRNMNWMTTARGE